MVEYYDFFFYFTSLEETYLEGINGKKFITKVKITFVG